MPGVTGLAIFGGGRNSDDIDRFTLNRAVEGEVRFFLQSSATAMQCHDVLERFLVRSLRVQGASRKFEAYVNKYYVPFFRRMIENILVLGWCPNVLRRVRIEPDEAPVAGAGSASGHGRTSRAKPTATAATEPETVSLAGALAKERKKKGKKAKARPRSAGDHSGDDASDDDEHSGDEGAHGDGPGAVQGRRRGGRQSRAAQDHEHVHQHGAGLTPEVPAEPQARQRSPGPARRAAAATESVLVPVVVPTAHASFELTANRRTHEFNMHCLSYDGSRPLRGVKYIFLHDRAKYANRLMMCSPLIGLLGELRFVEQMKKFAVQAEFVRTHPPVYLHAAKGSDSEVSSARMSGAMASAAAAGGMTYGPGGLGAAVARGARNAFSDDMTFLDAGEKSLPTQAEVFKNASSDMVSNIEFHSRQMDDFARNQNEHYYSLGLNYTPPHAHSLFVCPPGMTLATRPDTPQARTDQIALEANLASKIMIALGVPESIFGVSSKAVNITNALRGRGSPGDSTGGGGMGRQTGFACTHLNMMHLNTFDATLERYRALLREAFADVYFGVFRAHMPVERVIFEPPPMYQRYVTAILNNFDEVILQGEATLTALRTGSSPQLTAHEASRDQHTSKRAAQAVGASDEDPGHRTDIAESSEAKRKGRRARERDSDDDSDDSDDSDSGEETAGSKGKKSKAGKRKRKRRKQR